MWLRVSAGNIERQRKELTVGLLDKEISGVDDLDCSEQEVDVFSARGLSFDECPSGKTGVLVGRQDARKKERQVLNGMRRSTGE